MKFKVLLHRDARKFLEKLPKEDRERVLNKIRELEDPFSIKAVKVKGEEDVYRLRVGDYRILYFLDRERKIVVVAKIDRRERVYKK